MPDSQGGKPQSRGAEGSNFAGETTLGLGTYASQLGKMQIGNHSDATSNVSHADKQQPPHWLGMGPAKNQARFEGFSAEGGDAGVSEADGALGPIDAGRNSVASANKSLLNQPALGRQPNLMRKRFDDDYNDNDRDVYSPQTKPFHSLHRQREEVHSDSKVNMLGTERQAAVSSTNRLQVVRSGIRDQSQTVKTQKGIKPLSQEPLSAAVGSMRGVSLDDKNPAKQLPGLTSSFQTQNAKLMHRRKMALEHGYESAQKYPQLIKAPGAPVPSNTLNPMNELPANLDLEKKKSSQMSHFAYSSSDPADPSAFKGGLGASQQIPFDGNPNLETSPSVQRDTDSSMPLQLPPNIPASTQQAALSLLDQLMMNLKAINISALGDDERERLRLLSTQYQYYLTQFQHFQRQSVLMGHYCGEAGRRAEKTDVSPGVLESTDAGKTDAESGTDTAATEKAAALPPLPFQFHLNLPNPVPQITTADIKALIGPQRVQLFKQLQKRERNKFLTIQQAKFK